MIAAPNRNVPLKFEVRRECAYDRPCAAIVDIDAPPHSLAGPALEKMPPIVAPAEPAHDAQCERSMGENQPR